MQIDKRRAALQYQNKVNNAQGHFFEGAIKAACALYSERERADVDKTPRTVPRHRERPRRDFQGAVHSPRPAGLSRNPCGRAVNRL